MQKPRVLKILDLVFHIWVFSSHFKEKYSILFCNCKSILISLPTYFLVVLKREKLVRFPELSHDFFIKLYSESVVVAVTLAPVN